MAPATGVVIGRLEAGAEVRFLGSRAGAHVAVEPTASKVGAVPDVVLRVAADDLEERQRTRA